MRLIPFGTVVTVCVISAPSLAAFEPGTQVAVIEPAELKANHDVLEKLHRGTPLVVREEQGEWVGVNRRGGWVHRRHVRSLPDAIGHFSDLIAKNEQDESAYIIRGVLHSTAGDYDAAIADYTAVIRMNPANRGAYANRAVAWKHKGEYDIAISDYNEAIRLNPHSAMTWHNRGAAHVAKGNYARAVADFRETIRLDAQLPDAWNALAWMQATCPNPTIRNGAEAVKNATKACELTGYSGWHYLGTLAAANAEAGNFLQAERWGLRSLELAPLDKRDEAKARLQLFQAGRQYREPVGSGLPVTAAR